MGDTVPIIVLLFSSRITPAAKNIGILGQSRLFIGISIRADYGDSSAWSITLTRYINSKKEWPIFNYERVK